MEEREGSHGYVSLGEERGNKSGKGIIVRGSVTCEATPFGLVDETKGSCTGTRRIETTCVAPPHLGIFLDALMHVVVPF